MNRTFKISNPFRVPDGTLVSPFLNSKDNMSGLPFDLLDGFSLAAGIIEAGKESKIHTMPYVTQVTFVRSGHLLVRMKGPEDADFYECEAGRNEAVLTSPGTFFQLINRKMEPCEVLYIVSPAYLFEMVDKKVVYDDSVVLEEDWESLKSLGWRPNKGIPTESQRHEAERRLSGRRII